ncbi:MAG: phosphatase PAP2 family protein [Bacteroidales bacterium]|nr:phosphatase PAP2 family protein [Bacteroidales bacterium]
MKRILLLVFVLFSVFSLSLFAQEKTMQADTFFIQNNDKIKLSDKILNFRPIQIMYRGTPFIVEGAVMSHRFFDFRDFKKEFFPEFSSVFDSYYQFAPLTFTYALKLAGVESKSEWKDLLFSTGFSYALGYTSLKAIKNSIYTKRPDGSGNNSFPSGHTFIAFLNAHIMYKEYGEKSWLYPFGAYSLATITGIMRVMNNRHWIADVIGGAGFGILATETGYFLKDLFLYRPQQQYFVPSQEDMQTMCPSFFGISVTYNFSNNEYKINHKDIIRIKDGASTAIEGAYFYNKYFGIGLNADYTSHKLYSSFSSQDTNLSFYSLGLNKYFSYPIFNRTFLGARVGVAINHLLDNDIENSFSVEKNYFKYNTGLNLAFWMGRSSLLRFYADYIFSNIEWERKNFAFKTFNLGASVFFHF